MFFYGYLSNNGQIYLTLFCSKWEMRYQYTSLARSHYSGIIPIFEAKDMKEAKIKARENLIKGGLK